MKKATSEILPIIAMIVILSPVANSLRDKQKEEAPRRPVPAVRAPDPEVAKPIADPAVWFATIRSRCTPAEVTLATDLNRPPATAEGTAYKAACLALARQVPRARALLLGLPEDDRLRGASLIYDVAEGLAAQGRQSTAGPLMELVLEFWPNHYKALYGAGAARYAAGDLAGAENYLARFLDVYEGADDLSSSAMRMISHMAER